MRWVTRKKVKVDRVACPWLIRRFIDPEAAFVFLPAIEGETDGVRGVERSRGPLNPGTYPVKVQYRTTSGAQFTVDKWHMTVELARV